MAGRHHVLIVEDDKATADDLAEVLRSIGCDCVAVASHQEALQALRQTAFCLILLDLQIKHAPDAIKGHVEHGKALLREIRQMHSDHSGLPYWLPVLVVSGFASEVPAADLKAFIAYAKARPGELNYGRVGAGSVTEMLPKQFEKLAGISMTGVTFPASMSALLTA